MKQKIEFLIDYIDSLGQGVSKLTDKITFIEKTLPGESGTATILNSKSKIQFAHTKEKYLSKKSSLRINPLCPYFEYCTGCHYQHMNHDQELKFKSENIKRIFNLSNICIFKAPERFNYRNKIQLHYDLKNELIGFVSTIKNSIIEIPKCILPTNNIQKILTSLYKEKMWVNDLLKNKAPLKGHIEIHDDSRIIINKPYSDQGFSQANQAMNKVLVDQLTIQYNHWATQSNIETIHDLFGGNGNLSNKLNSKNIFIFDKYHSIKSKNFIFVDLFSKKFMNKFNEIPSPDLTIIDPPRAGFKDIKKYLEKFRPLFLIYVSCYPPTLKRDLDSIKDIYSLEKYGLIDLFPTTKHIESLCFLKLKNTYTNHDSLKK